MVCFAIVAKQIEERLVLTDRNKSLKIIYMMAAQIEKEVYYLVFNNSSV